jgi:FkbM family methyltransferase
MGVQAAIRRHKWLGVKPIASRLIALPVVNPLVTRAASLFLPASAVRRLPVRGKAEYRLASGERVLLLSARTDHVAKDLLWGGGAPTSRADARVLRYVESSSADTFLDVGSYSGLFAMIAAKSGCSRSIAFELLPENYFMILENVIANDLLERVEARLCGVADARGSIRMPRSTNSASHPTSMSLEAHYDGGVTIPLIAIDELGLSGPMLWKLDVEGFEWTVLRGARATLEHKPDIICEILPDFPHSSEIFELLKPLGYRFFISLDAGFEERLVIAPDPAGRDWIFTVDHPPGG